MLFFVFFIGFISSFIGILIPGTASALSVSSLILLGIPIQLSKTTYQLGNLGINIGALVPLFRTQKLKKDILFPLLVISLVTGILGGKILVTIPPQILMKLTGAFMIMLLFINLFSKTFGNISSEPSKRRKYVGFVGYFILNILFSILPMGMGILYQFLHTFFFRVTNLEARLLGCFLTIPFIIGFSFSIFQTSLYNIEYAIMFGIGGYLGGFIGAKSSIKLGNSFLKKILILWLFFLGLYFIIFG